MDENRLFNSFIAGQPANPNQYDRHAFVKYAIEALRNGNDLDSERLRQMRENGIPEEMIDSLKSSDMHHNLPDKSSSVVNPFTVNFSIISLSSSVPP